MEHYDLPFYKKSSRKWYSHIFFLIGILTIFACSIFSFVTILKDDFIKGLFLGLFMTALGIFSVYTYITTSIRKKYYIEMTTEYLKVSLPRKTILIHWSEIYQAHLFEFNGNTLIGILLKKDIDKMTKRTISNNFNSMWGIPPVSYQIPLTLFGDIDAEKLIATIEQQIDKNKIENDMVIESLNEDDTKESNNITKAIIFSTLTCIIICIVYGFTIYTLEANYVEIAILGSYIIISVFNKYYLEKSFSIPIRIFLGLMCFVQVPIATIGTIIATDEYHLTTLYLFDTVIWYFKFLIDNPSDSALVIIVLIICFTMGAFKGRTKIKEEINQVHNE